MQARSSAYAVIDLDLLFSLVSVMDLFGVMTCASSKICCHWHLEVM
jgi:hypothetical protein